MTVKKKIKKDIRKNKKAQEEMIGFGFIIIIVAVILLVFISFAVLSKDESAVESYEIESFLQAMLSYTANCSDYLGYLSIQDLIYSCQKGEDCISGEDTCEVLEQTTSNILKSSWQIENRPVKGYDLEIISEQEVIVNMTRGNQTGNYKGSTQKLPKEVDVIFNVYY